MLSELRIRDLAIIEQLDLSFAPGFNVLTGETGAGKSIIIDAVGLLLGDRASPEMVRAEADRTEVEGAFRVSPVVAERLASLLEDERAGRRRPRLGHPGARGAREWTFDRPRQRALGARRHAR